MKYLIIVLLSLIFSLSQAQTDTLIPKVFYYGDGTISSEGFFRNNQPVGYWKTYYPNGNLKSEGNREANALDGKWIFYNDQQDTTEIIHYRNSLKNGWNFKYDSNKVVSKELYLDGKIVGLSYLYLKDSYLEIPYKKHVKHGLAFEYKDSTIISLIEYKNGFKLSTKKINRYKHDTLKHGSWIEFYSNRKIHKEYFYKNDTLNGYYREYDIQGNLINNTFYENGSEQKNKANINTLTYNQTFYENGEPKTEGYYASGKPVGIHKTFSQDGKISKGILYDDDGYKLGEGSLDSKGRKTGKWTFYDRKNNKKSEGYYKKGRRTKEWIFYYLNGQIEQKGTYKSGKWNGQWIQYYETGTILKIENYKKGKLNGEFTQNKPNGDLFIQGTYLDNKLDQEWTYHHEFIVLHKFYKEGEKTGQWYSEYLNGKLAFKGEYENDLPNGKHIYYYRDGTIKEYRYYSYGNKERIWTYYDKFFEETYTYLYKNNKIVKIDGYKYKFSD